MKPIAIVNHITAGRYPGCLNAMLNPAHKASSHYLVTKDGQIFQLVRDEDSAWANGKVNKPTWLLYKVGINPNNYTLSIEHEALSGEGLTEQQYQATLWLHKQLIDRWGIPVDEEHIIGHNRIDSVDRPNDPGPNFPWARLFNDLKGGSSVSVPAWKTQVMQEALQKGLITQPHDPTEQWDAATILAVMLNLLKILGR